MLSAAHAEPLEHIGDCLSPRGLRDRPDESELLVLLLLLVLSSLLSLLLGGGWSDSG